jgi:hypothetical protein
MDGLMGHRRQHRAPPWDAWARAPSLATKVQQDPPSGLWVEPQTGESLTGWFDSSLDLRLGLDVIEGPP